MKLSTLALNIPTFDKLLDENKKNLKTIDELKATVARLEMEGVDKIKVVAETHTEHEFIEIPCNECVCMASCQEELDFHFEMTMTKRNLKNQKSQIPILAISVAKETKTTVSY